MHERSGTYCISTLHCQNRLSEMVVHLAPVIVWGGQRTPPMSRGEIEATFRGDASLVMSDDRATRVAQSVDALGTEPSLRNLMESLTL